MKNQRVIQSCRECLGLRHENSATRCSMGYEIPTKNGEPDLDEDMECCVFPYQRLVQLDEELGRIQDEMEQYAFYIKKYNIMDESFDKIRNLE